MNILDKARVLGGIARRIFSHVGIVTVCLAAALSVMVGGLLALGMWTFVHHTW